MRAVATSLGHVLTIGEPSTEPPPSALRKLVDYLWTTEDLVNHTDMLRNLERAELELMALTCPECGRELQGRCVHCQDGGF